MTNTYWRPSSLLGNRNGPAADPAYAVLVLNQPINENAFKSTVEGASMLVCADAGADRLRNLRTDQNWRRPDAIVGDLDSVTPETITYYRGKGVTIVKEPDQYSTDFTKALRWIEQEWIQRTEHLDIPPLDVVVLGGLGGRVDQGFSQIHHLYLAHNDTSLLSGRIYLLSEQSLTFVLGEGPNTIDIEPGYFAENVGIIPILGRCHLTTRGLEWDVENWPTDFGGQMSTSNHIRASTIEISFTGPRPLFTLELTALLTATGS
ncbi:Thiamine pyrophosphokinase [Cyphellophora attinorum]|uniref:Thiamine pyrophosphokinase n=1 Tax=Cyphellophora attinorum TaxID=1664694 RepID=A0A0N1P0I0_9EURO|nr:Thiamine pyrophosphokinase [Phialophora attinorum]KPI43325.1 Thiamine pyrophosphokinase [Phialophora attinorum]